MASRPAARHDRRQALHEHKRQAILAAARDVFLRQGLAGTTMRAVADAAGYVAGAVYAYFPTKEAIVGELLVQSLGSLSRAVRAAGSEAGLAAAAGALWAHYLGNPRELSLTLALLQEGGGTGLPPETERQINGRLIALLQVLAGGLRQEAAMPPPEAERAAVTLLATLAGLLLLQASGRLVMLGQDGDALAAQAVERLLR